MQVAGKLHSRRQAFTIVELLTVIGIIALLAALLLPAISRAREKANLVRCQSNAKQILMASTAFAADNDGVLPFPNFNQMYVGPVIRVGWLYMPPISNPVDPATVEAGQLWNYLHNREAYHCPSEITPFTSGPVQYLTSFKMNGATVAYGHRIDPYPLQKMKAGDIYLWEGGEEEPDNASPLSWTQGAAYPVDGFTSRHAHGGNVGFFDNHVEWMSDADYQAEANRTPGRLWCDPYRVDGR